MSERYVDTKVTRGNQKSEAIGRPGCLPLPCSWPSLVPNVSLREVSQSQAYYKLGNKVGSIIVPTLQMRKLRLPEEKHLLDSGQDGGLCRPHRETFGPNSSEACDFLFISKF